MYDVTTLGKSEWSHIASLPLPLSLYRRGNNKIHQQLATLLDCSDMSDWLAGWLLAYWTACYCHFESSKIKHLVSKLKHTYMSVDLKIE